MLALASANLAYVGAPAMPVSQRAAAPVMETEADLKVLAKKLNPGAPSELESLGRAPGASHQHDDPPPG